MMFIRIRDSTVAIPGLMKVLDAVRQFKIDELAVMTEVVGERLQLPLHSVKLSWPTCNYLGQAGTVTRLRARKDR